MPGAPKNISSQRRLASAASAKGLELYERWEVEAAIEQFRAASEADPTEPDHFLHLAQALARSGAYDKARRALADFMRLEPESVLTARFERLFATGMDPVEKLVTNVMKEHDSPLEEIAAAINMWLEYRIAIGRQPLNTRDPGAWAGALDYTVRKVNLHETALAQLAEWYETRESLIRKRHTDLVRTLDVMPCDYRYFRGKENPLDKLVEAAEMMERLEERFRQP
jgi:tetratricopeptide (TPR) repeat protein